MPMSKGFRVGAWLALAMALPGLSSGQEQRPTAALRGSAGPPPAFYRFSGPVHDPPGVLLRQQPLEERLQLPGAAEAVRFLYSSESFDGGAVAVSAAAFLPKGEAPPGGWPVVAWSHGTVGLADACAPSWRGRSPRDVDYLRFWLESGHAVVATDYEGLGTPGPHPYLHCRSAGMGNVDAVAAAQGLGWPLSKRWLVTGQSQGGHGALCTGALASERAPQLEFVGTLATAPGLSFLASYSGRHNEQDEPMRFLGVVLVNVRGMEIFTPEFSAEQALSEPARALLPRVEEVCVTELLEEGARLGLRTSTTFTTVPFSETPGVAEAVAQMEVPRGPWREPLLIGQGTEDPMTPFALASGYAKELCGNGAELTFLAYPGEGHSGPMSVGRGDFQAWAAARFAGEPRPGNCDALP